jgi:putative methionine-R-sulfoxide reductase with GAF domain
MVYLAGLALSVTLLSSNLALKEFRLERAVRQRNQLTKYIMDQFVSALGEFTKSGELATCRQTMFVPARGLKPLICRWSPKWLGATVRELKRKVVFVPTPKGHHPEYEVNPVTEGVVGACYAKRDSILVPDLKLAMAEYKFTDHQRSRVSNIGFWLCFPVIDKKNEVIAIVSLDTTSPILLTAEQKKLLSFMIVNQSIVLLDRILPVLKEGGYNA